MERANVFSAKLEYDPSDPEGYHAGMARVGQAAGGEELAVKLFEIPPGQSLCPYHYEYVEEWLLVLEGELVLRVPDGERQAGGVAGQPRGPRDPAARRWQRRLLRGRDLVPQSGISSVNVV